MTRLAILLAFAALPAAAQEPPQSCGPHADKVAEFAKTYDEHPVGAGIHLDGRLFEVLVNPETGSWSVFSTTPAGITCLVAGGMEWFGWVNPVGDPA